MSIADSYQVYVNSGYHSTAGPISRSSVGAPVIDGQDRETCDQDRETWSDYISRHTIGRITYVARAIIRCLALAVQVVKLIKIPFALLGAGFIDADYGIKGVFRDLLVDVLLVQQIINSLYLALVAPPRLVWNEDRGTQYEILHLSSLVKGQYHEAFGLNTAGLAQLIRKDVPNYLTQISPTLNTLFAQNAQKIKVINSGLHVGSQTIAMF